MQSKDYSLAPEPTTKAERNLTVFMPFIQYQICLNKTEGECILKGEREVLGQEITDELSDEHKALKEEFSVAVMDLTAKYIQAVENLPKAEPQTDVESEN